MGRIVVTEFISLDGVIEDPGGAESFRHGGWTFRFERGEEGDRFKLQETLDAEALLLGRVTYEGFAAAWPSITNEFADKMNTMPKYVVSSTLSDPQWANTTVIGSDVASEVPAIRDAAAGDLLVAGSAGLVQGLFAADLVDELRLMVFPIVLGSGKRLFADSDDARVLSLSDVRQVGDGIVIQTYARAA